MTTFSRSLRQTVTMALLAGGTALSVVTITTAQAKDLSLPYRNYPGFTCHHWNAAGECTDFSYFDGATAPVNSYVQPYVAPVYVAPPAYNYGNYNYNTYPYNNSYNGNVIGCAYNDPYCTNGYNGRISVRATGSPNPVRPNDYLTYSIYVRNDDSVDRSISLSAFLDTDTTYDRASNGGRSYGSNEVRWTNLRIPRRSSATLSLTVRVRSGVRTGTAVLRVQTAGSSDTVTTTIRDDRYTNCSYNDPYCNDYNGYNNCPSYDPYCNDNYSNCSYNDPYCDDRSNDNCDNYSYNSSYNYSSNCDVQIRVNANTTDPLPGGLVTFTIVVTNDESQSRTIDIDGVLDPDLDFYSASDGGRERGSNNVEWNSIYVGSRSSETITLTARVNSGARRGDTLSFEARTDGDSDEATVRVR